jgi:hypothetical protein
MKLLIFLIFLALGSGGNTPAEQDPVNVTLQGTVFESGTSEPIPGATVYIEYLNLKVFTDFDGNFSLENLQPGKYTLRVSFPSFTEKTLKSVEIVAGGNSLLVAL